MDCMAFGMGCCCLQVTFQAKNLAESRYLYDQLSVLSPIMVRVPLLRVLGWACGDVFAAC